MAAPEYEQLLVVQRLDTQLDQLCHRHDHHPLRSEITELQRTLDVQQADFDGIEVQKHELDRKQKRLDDEVSLVEDKRSEIDGKLYDGTVTATKDLLALQDEARMLLERQTAIEDDELEIMEELEPIESALAAAGDTRDATTRSIIAKEAELEVALADVEGERVQVETDRRAAIEPVASELRAAYEQLRSDLGGVAITQLSGSSCSGCNLTLSAVDIDQIKKLPDDAVVTCPACGRLLIR